MKLKNLLFIFTVMYSESMHEIKEDPIHTILSKLHNEVNHPFLDAFLELYVIIDINNNKAEYEVNLCVSWTQYLIYKMPIIHKIEDLELLKCNPIQREEYMKNIIQTLYDKHHVTNPIPICFKNDGILIRLKNISNLPFVFQFISNCIIDNNFTYIVIEVPKEDYTQVYPLFNDYKKNFYNNNKIRTGINLDSM